MRQLPQKQSTASYKPVHLGLMGNTVSLHTIICSGLQIAYPWLPDLGHTPSSNIYLEDKRNTSIAYADETGWPQ